MGPTLGVEGSGPALGSLGSRPALSSPLCCLPATDTSSTCLQLDSKALPGDSQQISAELNRG